MREICHHSVSKKSRGEKQHLLYRSSKFTQFTFSILSLTLVFFFGSWWFQLRHLPHNFIGISHVLDVVLFLLVSFVIWHPIVMDVLTWFISLHIKDIRRQKPATNLKVAFITTIVPANEPLSLLHKCLPAMVKAKYPHDTWLLDESNNREVKEICRQYGVKHFTRHGKSEFNTPSGKFTRTKGGNHNAWYAQYGNTYDIVAQIDTDFVPKSSFLTKTLGYFRDPDVGFVGTPQIYGNTGNSLIAKGAAEQQYTFYGSVLRGLSGMRMMLLIGANHVVRVAALRDVNHYSAHITEDLLTGMKLHTRGWKSVYVPEALAVGEGPSSWESYFNQQLRWAYGCMDILFRHSPRLLKKMNWRQGLYYFFLQQHYFSGIAMASSILMLTLYFIFGIRAANVDMVKFFVSYSFVMVACWLMSVWLQQFNIHRKQDGELFLAGKIISIAAWPIWFLAFMSIVTHIKLKYKVTPKGELDTQGKTSLFVFLPHLFFGFLSVAGLILSCITHRHSSVMVFWAFSSAIVMLSVPFIERIARAVVAIRKQCIRLVLFVYERHIRQQSQATIASHGQRFAYSTTAVQKAGTHTFRKLSINNGILDVLFLTLVVILSLILYLPDIGFYSDDWSFLGNFMLSSDHSLWGLIRTATTPNTFMRPGQNVYDALLYWLFGTNPLGYQLFNADIMIGITLLFYVTLRYLKLPRSIAVSVPLLFILLPQYSTDRFWYASFQVNLSIFFYLLSLITGLQAISLTGIKSLALKTLSILCLLFSVLNYEVAMPLVLINLMLFWNPIEKLKNKNTQTRNNTIFVIMTTITLAYLFFFKAMTTTRLGAFNYPGDIIRIVRSVFYVNYWVLGAKIPYVLSTIVTHYYNPTIVCVSVIMYGFVLLYVLTILSQPQSLPSSKWMRNLTVASIFIFSLGYAIFFTNNKVGFSPTGIDNRVAIAAAIGIAFSLVGGIGWVSRLLFSERVAKVFFSNAIALVSAGGFLIINTLSLFWINAYHRQEAVLADIQQAFPVPPQHGTILLDGVCPYVGPGIVFESQWDLKGALQTIYKDATLRADIVTPRLRVSSRGISTQIYTFPSGYSYHNLYVYNNRQKRKYVLHNATEAQVYFHRFNPDRNNGCPPSSAGNGVSVF